jgi:predicted nucleotidyltransferase
MVQNKKDILNLLSAYKAELMAQFKVHDIALFGSWARGDQRPDSDVDILVEVDPSIGLGFVTLAKKLEELLGTKVDLVSRRAVKQKSLEYIERELIYV